MLVQETPEHEEETMRALIAVIRQSQARIWPQIDQIELDAAKNGYSADAAVAYILARDLMLLFRIVPR